MVEGPWVQHVGVLAREHMVTAVAVATAHAFQHGTKAHFVLKRVLEIHKSTKKG